MKTMLKISFIMFLLTCTGVANAQLIDTDVWRAVGSNTFDSCENDMLVFNGANGEVTVMKGQELFIELRDYATEVLWYCGNEENRSKSGGDFLAVFVKRNDNGRRFEIHYFAKR